MKQLILTISSILVLSNIAYAKKCTTENVGRSPKGEAMNTTWQGPDLGYQVEYTHGRVKGVIKFYENRVEVKRNILVGIAANGNVIIDDPDDGLGSWEVPCSMSDDGNYMTISGDYQLVFRSAFPAKYVPGGNTASTKQNYEQPVKQAVNKDLDDWAPTKQEPKVEAAPVARVNSSGGSKVSTSSLGDWAPSAR